MYKSYEINTQYSPVHCNPADTGRQSECSEVTYQAENRENKSQSTTRR